jgi:AraC-like DNA-binding protein
MLKYFLCLSGRTAPKLLASAGVPCGQLCRLLPHVELRGLFDDLIREGGHHGPRTAEICTLMFKLLVLKMARAVEHGGAADDPARESFLRCKALIDAQADRLSTLQEVAALVKLDTSSVCRLFRRYVDTSPYQYLLRRKMNMAAEFLLEQRVLVKEAAFRVGFPDPYHFSRCFKACHGVSPRELQGRAKV